MGSFDDELAMLTTRSKSPLERIPLASWIEREAALYALRMIQGQRWHRRLVDRNGIRDSDTLSLIGLVQRDEFEHSLTSYELRDGCAKQQARLEAGFRSKPDVLSRNLDTLASLLKLSVPECAILRLAVVMTRSPHFANLFQEMTVTEYDLLVGLRCATGCRFTDMKKALLPDRTLRQSGFLEHEPGLFGSHSNPISIDDAMAEGLLSHRFNEERLLRHLTRAAPKSTLTLDDFSHISDLDLVSRYLKQSVSRRRKGANILIHGEPGTGKTEFVRTLAEASGIVLNEVPNSNSDGEAITGQTRFCTYRTTQRLLASRRNQALLFDEVEDVFGDSNDLFASLFGSARHGSSDPRKSWINETLESNPVPTIWVCNQIRGIDPAYLRRFDLIMEFRAPTRQVRQRIVERHFKTGEISSDCVERLIGVESLTPALVERAARVVRTVRSRSVSQRDAEVERIVRSGLRVIGRENELSAPVLPGYYDPTLINSDRELDVIVQGLARTKSARMCLYGPPGTGKSAFAHHLGQTLDKSVLVRRASDLLDPYIGGTEAKLRAAFDAARDEGAILLIDEADSFLQERSGAHRSWEITQVNELLTQMESFNGIFIASTNLIDRLDSASLRRFDFKLKFDYLTRDQRRTLLSRVVDNSSKGSEDWEVAAPRLDQLSRLTPGDFTNVLRQLKVTGQRRSAAHIIDLLTAEIAMKAGASKPSMGFVRH